MENYESQGRLLDPSDFGGFLFDAEAHELPLFLRDVGAYVKAHQCKPEGKPWCANYNPYVEADRGLYIHLFPCVSLSEPHGVDGFQHDPKRPWRCINCKPDAYWRPVGPSVP